MQTETSIQSLEPIRGTSSRKSCIHSSVGIPETDSEGGSGTASSLSRSARHTRSFQRELPFTMQRWLTDADTSQPTKRLVNSTESPDDVCLPDLEYRYIPTSIADIPSKQGIPATDEMFQSSWSGHKDISLLEVGAWCSDDGLRWVQLEIFYCIWLTDCLLEKKSIRSAHVKLPKNLQQRQKFSDPLWKTLDTSPSELEMS